MNKEKDSIFHAQRDIRSIIGRYLDLSCYAVFLFGSRAAGKGDNRSDIDIGIEGDQPVPSPILAKIKDDIDRLPMLYKVDVVDFTQVSTQFRDVAKKHCIPFSIE